MKINAFWVAVFIVGGAMFFFSAVAGGMMVVVACFGGAWWAAPAGIGWAFLSIWAGFAVMPRVLEKT